jgi:hypothetical protein
MIALMMEAASTSKTSVKFYQTTRRNNPEDSHFQTSRRDNLNSNDIKILHVASLINAISIYSSLITPSSALRENY